MLESQVDFFEKYEMFVKKFFKNSKQRFAYSAPRLGNGKSGGQNQRCSVLQCLEGLVPFVSVIL